MQGCVEGKTKEVVRGTKEGVGGTKKGAEVVQGCLWIRSRVKGACSFCIMDDTSMRR